MNITEILSGVKLGSLTLGDAIGALITALVILVIIKALLKVTKRLLSGTKLDGKVLINNIGTTIGSHTGPGTVALFFWGDERVD